MPVLNRHHFMWEGVFDVDRLIPPTFSRSRTARSRSPDGNAVEETTDGGVTWRRRADIENLVADYRLLRPSVASTCG